VPTTAEITIETDDGPMPAFEAFTDGEPKGAVVVLQEAFGVTAHIQDVARRLADDGWRAVAPALFHRQGSPVLDYGDMEKVIPVMSELNREGLVVDLTSTFDYLEAAGFASSRTGVVGFCMGGAVAFLAGTLRPLGAAVTFYGGGIAEGRFGLPSLLELAQSLQSPWLGCYGDLDQRIPVKEVEQLRKAAADSAVPTEIVRYADADHGFNCDDRPQVYNPIAAHDAWLRTLEWFDQHVAE